MKYTVKFTAKFKKDYKLALKRGYKSEKIETVIALLAELSLLMQREKKGDFVFCTEKGTVQSPRTWSRRHYNIFMRDMHEYYKIQGIEIPILHPHELRHTRASLWVNSGANLFAVADVLGHADLKMLRKRYAHSDVESTRELLKIDSDEN